MQTEIHGHEVLDLIRASERPFTTTSLATAIVERFGPDARFYTCSASGLTAEELIIFFAQRGKFAPAGLGWTLAAGGGCGH